MTSPDRAAHVAIVLTVEDISKALPTLPRKLTPRQVDAFRKRSNEALATWLKLQTSNVERSTPSDLSKSLRRIQSWAIKGNRAKTLLLLSESGESAGKILWRAASRRGLFNGPFETDRKQLYELPLGILAELAEYAADLQRGRSVSTRKIAMRSASPEVNREGRHGGKVPTQILIAALTRLWAQYFREIPGIAIDSMAEGSPPSGEYVNFMYTLLRTYASHLDTANAQRLTLSRQAIRGYFRRTGISNFRRFETKLRAASKK